MIIIQYYTHVIADTKCACLIHQKKHKYEFVALVHGNCSAKLCAIESLYVFQFGNRNDPICQNWRNWISFSVFQFALSLRKLKTWRHKTDNLKNERAWPQKLRHAHFQFQFAEKWKTERLWPLLYGTNFSVSVGWKLKNWTSVTSKIETRSFSVSVCWKLKNRTTMTAP